MKINRHKNSLKVSAFITLLASSVYAAPPVATQLPTGSAVVGGAATVSQAGAVMQINQATPRAAINWQTFNVGSAATVNIAQPNASSVLLNRVLDTNASQIFGKVNANGQVFLVNPNGVYFAPSASVNVGSFLATTANISTADFMAGLSTFSTGGATGSIINDGNLTAALGGYIALLAPSVINNGVVIARMGTVALAAGNVYELQFAGNTLSNVQVSASTVDAFVSNGNAIYAPGGLIILSTQAAHQIQGGVIGNTGVLDATGVTNSGGVIRLITSSTINAGGVIKADAAPNSVGNGGTVDIIADLTNSNSKTNITGSISAKGGSLGGNGGQIDTSASHVKVADSAVVTTLAPKGDAGTWTIDPTDFTIAATGGNITGTVLAAQLAGRNVAIISSTGSAIAGSGDINVNDTVSWTANELSLTAAHSININSQMNATGTSSLVMKTSTANGSDLAVAGGTVNTDFNADGTFAGSVNFGNRSGTGLLTVNDNVYTVINNFGSSGSTTVDDFQAMGATGYYALGNNLNAGGISTGGITAFTGMFNGLGHTISGVNIVSAAAAGLFGAVGVGSYIQNIGLIGGSVQGGVNSGGLIGWNYGTVSNAYNTGTIASTGGGQGGLIGKNQNGNVINSYATGTVSGAVNIGGLIGENMAGQIIKSYATGSVTSAAAGVGGLVGYSTTGDIVDSCATGAVLGATGVGGLLGGGTSGNVTNSHATGTVSGTTNTGGLVGSVSSGVVSKSYATGNVNGTTSTGGLVCVTTGAITTSYASGAVMGVTNTGGLVANSTSSVSDSYATGSVTGSAGSTGGLIGITTGTTATSYETGQVNTGSAGLIGNSTTTVTSSYFNKSLNTGVTTYGTGLSTAQMVVMSNFVGFSISTTGGSTWFISDGVSNPYLTGLMTPVSVTANSTNTIYSGSAYIGSVTYSVTPQPILGGTLSYSYLSGGLITTSATNAGSYVVIPSGLISTQQYLVSFADGGLVISPKSITVTDTASSTTYNGTSTYASVMSTAGYTNTALVGSDAIGALTQVATISSAPVSGVAQAGSFISTPCVAMLSTGPASNYDFTYVPATNTVAQAGLAIAVIPSPLNDMLIMQTQNSIDSSDCPNKNDVHIGGVGYAPCDKSNIKALGFFDDDLLKLQSSTLHLNPLID